MSLEHEEALRKGVPLALARELQAKLGHVCAAAFKQQQEEYNASAVSSRGHLEVSHALRAMRLDVQDEVVCGASGYSIDMLVTLGGKRVMGQTEKREGKYLRARKDATGGASEREEGGGGERERERSSDTTNSREDATGGASEMEGERACENAVETGVIQAEGWRGRKMGREGSVSVTGEVASGVGVRVEEVVEEEERGVGGGLREEDTGVAVLRQLSYYFSDGNWRTDSFLRSQAARDPSVPCCTSKEE